MTVKQCLGAMLVIVLTLCFSSSITLAAKKTIHYWVAVDPDRWNVYNESIKEFNKQNPDIHVVLHKEIGDNVQVQQKLLTMLAAGTPPDVIHVDTMYVEDMARAGTIVPLDQFSGASELAAHIFPGAMEPLIVDQKIYGYPIRANSIQLLYNKQMFREAGLDPALPPRTFAQMIEVAKKLTKRDSRGNVDVYGYETGMTKDPHWTAHVFSPILWSYGGSYVSQSGEAGFSGVAGVKSIDYWDTLINQHQVAPTERITSGFQTGKVAMAHTGEWDIKPYKRDFPNLDFGFYTLPVSEDGVEPVIPLGGRAVVIPKGVNNPEEAWRLIQWVMNKEEQMRYTSSEVGLTPRTDLADDPWFLSNPEYHRALLDMVYVKAKAAPHILEMNTLLSDAIQKSILLNHDPQDALDEAATKYNAILGK